MSQIQNLRSIARTLIIYYFLLHRWRQISISVRARPLLTVFQWLCARHWPRRWRWQCTRAVCCRRSSAFSGTTRECAVPRCSGWWCGVIMSEYSPEPSHWPSWTTSHETPVSDIGVQQAIMTESFFNKIILENFLFNFERAKHSRLQQTSRCAHPK